MSPLFFIILLPILTGLFCFIGISARRLAITGSTLNLILVLSLFGLYDLEARGFQFLLEFPILPAYGLAFLLGTDGLSLVMLLLSALVTFGAVWCAHPPEGRDGLFYGSLMFISAGAIGAFASLDMFFFYAFHELALIPTFLLIGIWGTGDRQAAAWKATIYLALGSFVLLIGLIGLYLSCPEGMRTFDMRELHRLAGDGLLKPSSTVYLLLLFGFGTLVSIFPFHTWAPAAYACAPPPAAMLHAGVLKKFGLYGLLRLVEPIFPEQIEMWANLLLVLLACNILYVGFVTMAQRRLDWMLGYSSVMHMGYIFLGFAALNELSLTGAGILLFAHGLSIAALFALAGEIRSRTGTLDFAELGGLAKAAPRLGLLFGFAAMAAVGLPGFANFAGEVLVFFGAFRIGSDAHLLSNFQIVTIIAVWGVVISAVYMLRAYRSIFFGEMPERWAGIGDIGPDRRLPVVLLILFLMIVGFYPQLLVVYFTPPLPWP